MAINVLDRFGRSGGAGETASRAAVFELSEFAKALVASLSAGAGVIHLVMVPSHMGESAVEGVGFAIAGWLQLAVALLVFARPSRTLLSVAIAANAALIAAWAVSRTAGLPFGEHAGHPEAATLIDLTCVGLEAAVIAFAGLLLVRPDFDTSWDGSTRVVALAAPALVLLMTTLALTSPSARDHAAHSHGEHAGDDKGLSLLTNGHHHEFVRQELDPATQSALDGQLALSRRVAGQYPTVADAEAAGYTRAGPYSPGLGAHYIKYGAAEMNADGVVDENDAQHPLAIIYDGTDPNSRVAGFMYYSMSASEPQGFIGPNDVWHYHERICLKFANGKIEAPFGADKDATDQQCAAAGGSILPVTQWMAHVWSAPGYDNVNGGVFAEVNPALDCSDGTYYELPADQWAAHPLNVCRSGS